MNVTKSKYSILVCGDFSSKIIPLCIQCAEAFEQLGFAVFRADTEDHINKKLLIKRRFLKSFFKIFGFKSWIVNRFQKQDRLSRSKEALALLENSPDFVLVVRGNDLDPSFYDALKNSKKKIHSICWWIKDLRTVAKIPLERLYFDTYFCIHRNIAQNGIEYLPAYARDLTRFSSIDTQVAKVDVVFVGVWTPKRQMYLEAISDQNLLIVGPLWGRKIRRHHPLRKALFSEKLFGDDLCKFYSNSRIVVNINQWEGVEATGTTLRIVDVPCCRTLLLSEYSSGLSEIFSQQEIPFFSNPEELRSRVIEFLSNEKIRINTVDRAFNRVLQLPDYKERMTQLLHLVGCENDEK